MIWSSPNPDHQGCSCSGGGILPQYRGLLVFGPSESAICAANDWPLLGAQIQIRLLLRQCGHRKHSSAVVGMVVRVATMFASDHHQATLRDIILKHWHVLQHKNQRDVKLELDEPMYNWRHVHAMVSVQPEKTQPLHDLQPSRSSCDPSRTIAIAP